MNLFHRWTFNPAVLTKGAPLASAGAVGGASGGTLANLGSPPSPVGGGAVVGGAGAAGATVHEAAVQVCYLWYLLVLLELRIATNHSAIRSAVKV